jgi:glycerol-3-phosphate dehydrogenase
MLRNLSRLRSGQFDIVVVGGGITGACIAHDAALRGLSVALLERDDFGGATSAGSSRILHGGIRYLQSGDLLKARASMRERACFQSIAPHLTAELPILIPARGRGMQGRAALRAAAAAYSLLTADENRYIPNPSKRLPSPRLLPRQDAIDLAPALAGDASLTGALLLYESQMHSPERTTLAFITTADANDAVVANYCGVEGVIRRGTRIVGVRAVDRIGGGELEVRARLVINAAGPWLNTLNTRMAVGLPRRRPSWPSKGIHILTRSLVPGYGLAVPSRHRARTLVDRGGRHLFILPWRQHSQIGTTNTRYDGSPDDLCAQDSDIDSLIADVNAALPGVNLTRDDVTHAYGGLFPITHSTERPEIYQVTGDHQIVDHVHTGGVEGFISVLGSKFTLARRVAQRAVDAAQRKLGYPPSPCSTASAPLAGAATEASAPRDVGGRVIPASLFRAHGSGAGRVLDVANSMHEGLRPLVPGAETLRGEVLFAVTQEMAQHLEDVVQRRTALGALGHPGTAVLQECARIMAPQLGWSAAVSAAEVERAGARFPIRPRGSARADRRADDRAAVRAGA